MDENISVNGYKLTLTRQKAVVGCAVAFKIYIDNVKVGKIKNGQTIVLNVSAGNHIISVNKNNAVNIEINGDTTADVVVFGANNFGITNISGQSSNVVQEQINNNYVEKSKGKTNLVFWVSIILPVLSFILIYTAEMFITEWVYGLLIGLAIVNLFGLKNQNNDQKTRKSMLIKNIVTIIISTIMIFVTIYIRANYT